MIYDITKQGDFDNAFYCFKTNELTVNADKCKVTSFKFTPVGYSFLVSPLYVRSNANVLRFI